MTSTTFRQNAYAQEAEDVLIVLLTLSSDEIAQPIRVTNDPYEKLPLEGTDVYGCVSNGDTYVFAPFDIVLPRDDKSGIVNAKLSIENVSRDIVGTIRSITKPLDVSIQIVLSSDVDFVELEYTNFKLSNIKYNAMNAVGDLTFDYWGLEPLPSHKFTPSGYPGLF